MEWNSHACAVAGCRFCGTGITQPEKRIGQPVTAQACETLGGENNVQSGKYERRDYRPIRFVRERSYKKMRLAKPDDNKHIVIVKKASRDEKTGKIKYVTVESFDVFESNDKEVTTAVVAGLQRASGAK
jgi:hypothetical protein